MNIIFKSLRVMIPIITVLLLIIQVIVSNELATLGKRMGQLDAAVIREQDVHEALETQVASASSLLSLREKAIVLGFHEPLPNQITALLPQVPVAYSIR